MNNTRPIVWTIAGSDSGGGAGIQADLASFHDFNVRGCSVITALTAQNSYQVTDIVQTSSAHLKAQIAVLAEDLPPKAIKIGMLGDLDALSIVGQYLKNYDGMIILDPVMVSTSGSALSHGITTDDLVKHLFSCVDLITPNLIEAQALLGISIKSNDGIEKAAKKLHHMGAKAVLIKGGHDQGRDAQDFYYSASRQFWLSTPRIATHNTHGSGCTLSAAIAACCALGHSMADALVMAKIYVTQGIRLATAHGQGAGAVAHAGWSPVYQDLPRLSPMPTLPAEPFLPPQATLGFYPIVERYAWVQRLLRAGVKTLQLRIKPEHSLKPDEIASEIAQSITLAKTYQAQLFINDYWQLAIDHQAYGVHLGQEDLEQANLHAIKQAGLRLGISTHCYAEVARALAIQPSYIAYGPVYETTAKPMAFAPQGVQTLADWQKILTPHYPLVAIGGISLARLPEVLATGVDGVAVISAITQAADPERAIQDFLDRIQPDAQDDLMPRYQRQMVLPEIGYTGQQRLSASRILCVGAGGLGSPLLLYLAGAGVGTIGIIDDDTVSLSNLHRQVLYQTQDCGQKKALIAAKRLNALNPQINIIAHPKRLNADNAADLMQDYDLIADASDNFNTRYLINRTCFALKKPLVSASVMKFSGQLVSFIPPSTPCYACLFPPTPAQDTLPNCNEAGVLGATAGVLGTLQAVEIIKRILQQASQLNTHLLRIDLLAMRFDYFKRTHNLECDICQPSKDTPSPEILEPIDLEITPEALQHLKSSGQPLTLLDVRSLSEYQAYNNNDLFIPLNELNTRYAEIPSEHLVIVYCRSGQRSLVAAQWLHHLGMEVKSFNGTIEQVVQVMKSK